MLGPAGRPRITVFEFISDPVTVMLFPLIEVLNVFPAPIGRFDKLRRVDVVHLDHSKTSARVSRMRLMGLSEGAQEATREAHQTSALRHRSRANLGPVRTWRTNAARAARTS